MEGMSLFEISIVTYYPVQEELERLGQHLAGNLAILPADVGPVTIRVLDNSEDPEIAPRLRAILTPLTKAPHTLVVEASPRNVGFGVGHNRNLEAARAEFVLLLNQNIEIEPGALADLINTARRDEARVAAWEMRQIPYEHPKEYNPVNLDTTWVSGAATLFRRSALAAVGGFDPHIFMYGEDVDLSWRLRAAGWRLRYLPRCAVIHRTYETPGQIKRMQVLGGTLTNLCLRARYGGGRQVLQGVAMLRAEMLVPQAFPGRRLGLFLNLFRFAKLLPYFWRTRVRPTNDFQPRFSGWNYELRRQGDFFEFPSRQDWPGPNPPKVSIMIRTTGRLSWLRQALASAANQTYPNVEVVLVEDGPATCTELVREFSERLPVRYEALGTRCGRSVAGNRALALASGEWLCFLDDDDLLFADHVEVCLYSALKHGVAGAYAIGWETHTRTRDKDSAEYEEVLHIGRHAQPFDRITLWHHNFLPIQTVIFHRRLYEKHGGFAEDMHQLEDWNLWTRYTLEDDFQFVPKVTSKYRVPTEQSISVERQKALDEAYAKAVHRQSDMRFVTTPREIAAQIERHVAARSLVRIEIPHPRNWLRRPRVFSWLLARRHLLRGIARRLGIG